MKPVREIVSRDVIEDLWGAGYTILPRARHPDPFHVPQDMVPSTRSYQWMHLVHDKSLFMGPCGYELGWSPVPASRHDGYFMPAGHVGDIEVSGLGLFEKPKFEVDGEYANQVAAAHQQVDDWAKKYGGQFSGSVTVGKQTELGHLDSVDTFEVGATKSVENITAIPREMTPYIGKIFSERDYLGKQYADELASDESTWSTLLLAEIASKMEAALRADPSLPKWPTLNAIILPYAIENVRKRITEEATHGQAS